MRKHKRIEGKLLDAGTFLAYGDIMAKRYGFMGGTLYKYEYKDKNDKQVRETFVFPEYHILPKINPINRVSIGDRFILSQTEKYMKVEIRSKYLRRLKHKYKMTHEKIDEERFIINEKQRKILEKGEIFHNEIMSKWKKGD